MLAARKASNPYLVLLVPTLSATLDVHPASDGGAGRMQGPAGVAETAGPYQNIFVLKLGTGYT